MKMSISIASPHTRRSGPKCLSDGRSRITATSDATNTASSTISTVVRSSTSTISRAIAAGIP